MVYSVHDQFAVVQLFQEKKRNLRNFGQISKPNIKNIVYRWEEYLK